MKKILISFFVFVCIFSVSGNASAAICPEVIQIEDSLGNVGVNNIVENPNASAGPISSSAINGSFVRGTVNTLTLKVIANNRRYRFWTDSSVLPYRDPVWSTDNSFTFDLSTAINPNYSSLHFRAEVDDCSWGTSFSYSVVNPAPATCTSWTYSDWSSCSNNGQQTRSTISSSPNSCACGSPVLTQSCTYTPPACTSWTYSDWSTCQSNNTQNRTAISSSPSSCSGGSPVLTQSCTYAPPTCTSWNYSNWSVCASNQQTRTITSSQPTNCTGGNPTLNQSCNSIPLCTEKYRK